MDDAADDAIEVQPRAAAALDVHPPPESVLLVECRGARVIALYPVARRQTLLSHVGRGLFTGFFALSVMAYLFSLLGVTLRSGPEEPLLIRRVSSGGAQPG